MYGRNDIRDWLALVSLPGLGCVLLYRLLTAFGAPGKVLAAGSAVVEVPGVGRRLTEIFTSPSRIDQARSWAEQEYDRVCANDIHLLLFDDPLYPALLRNIHDFPMLLYCLGDLDCLRHPAVALVGSRTASDYGKRVSFMLARQLVKAGFVVVSGLARGIDGQAHLGALQAKGRTIAVLGCGLDVVYPSQHTHLHEQIGEQGLLISEYPLGTRPEGFRFPARNRIVSGLSLGVVVVEAAVRSGALITARMALDQNREVFAVPGRIDSKKSAGAHNLLRQGAGLVRTVEDILGELPPMLSIPEKKNSFLETPIEKEKISEKSLEGLTEEEKNLLNSMEISVVDIEELSEKTSQSISSLHGLLLGLELKGLIRQLPGQQYELA
ncbi:MAG: DNA-protecting protein DprA [Candidatus Electrothrix sp. AR4]|nr:DNA-protecting protein DprA [Candidatus Electrothrix sp. AR4]